MRQEIEELLALVEAKKNLAMIGDGYNLQDALSSQVKLVKTLNDKEITKLLSTESAG